MHNNKIEKWKETTQTCRRFQKCIWYKLKWGPKSKYHNRIAPKETRVSSKWCFTSLGYSCRKAMKLSKHHQMNLQRHLGLMSTTSWTGVLLEVRDWVWMLLCPIKTGIRIVCMQETIHLDSKSYNQNWKNNLGLSKPMVLSWWDVYDQLEADVA